jgi:hypothetical protein
MLGHFPRGTMHNELKWILSPYKEKHLGLETKMEAEIPCIVSIPKDSNWNSCPQTLKSTILEEMVVKGRKILTGLAR